MLQKKLGEYPEAFNVFSESLNYYPTDSVFRSTIYANIAQIFQLQNDMKQATTHLQHALALSGSKMDNIGYLLTLHALANVHGINGAIDSALLLDEEGIAISIRINDPASEITFLDNKANCFIYTDRPDSARYYFHKSLFIDSSLSNKKQMSDAWLNLGYLERMYGNTEKTERLLNHAIELANGIGYRHGILSAYKGLSEMYAKRRDFEKALYAESHCNLIKDIVVNLKKETAVAEWKRFMKQEKEDQIRLQNLQLKQKISVYGLSASAVFYY